MAADAILKTRKSDLSWYKLDKKVNKVSFPANSHHTCNRMIFIMFWYHLDIQNQNGCPKVATDAILRDKNSDISIFHEGDGSQSLDKRSVFSS